MKKTFIFLCLCCCLSIQLHAQSSAYSYVRTRTMTNASATAWIDHIDYDNGIGDVYQQVDVGITPGHQDLVTLHEYDSHRRSYRVWLPGLGSGGICQDSIALKSSAGTVNSDDCPYSTSLYEPTPLGQVRQQYQPGNAWYQNQKAQIFTEAVEANDVARYKVMNLIMASNTLLYTGYINNSKLIKETTDEDGVIHQEFADMSGNVVVRRQQSGTGWLATYYVYDDSNRLRFVLPPAAANYFETNLTSAQGISPTHDQMLKYAYEYRYDGRGNCIYKRLPGCEPVYYVYDHADRCIFSQTGIQRASGQWTYTIPDVFGRTALTGTCHNSLTYTAEPLHNTVVTATRTNATNSRLGYTLNNITLSSDTLYSVNFYDDYNFIGSNGVPSSLSYASPPSGDYGSNGLSSPQGIITGTVTARLGSTGVTGYDYAAMYYDDRGRVVQTHSTNHLGGTEAEYTGYDFTDHVLKLRHDHSAYSQPHTQVYTYDYDHAGRLTTKTHKLDNNSTVTLESKSYNDLGQLASCTSNGTLTTSYTYNVRSWLKTITTGTLFSEALYYNESYNGNTPCYSGNISAMQWVADAKTRAYRFLYDDASRLTQAYYMENNGNTHYNTQYSYDRMGNITSLQRYGLQDNNTYGLVDNLTLTYDGNQLVKADDDATDPTYAGAFNFVDGTDTTTEYEYDQNGNMTKDLNKNILSIQYNLLNLPTGITYSDGRSAAYIYDADGKKLRTSYKVSAQATPVPTDYCGNMIYENNVLNQILVDGGYVTFSGTTPQYHFYLKDHLGNNRVVARADGTVEQVNHYYPFGGLMGESTGGDTQRYKYNGKELDRMHGLDWYDYGARYFDAARGQFTTTDPLCEKDYKTSPYTYCGDNPINTIDFDGRSGFKLLLKAAYKIGKTVARNGLSSLSKSATYATAFSDVVEDTKTLFDSNASTWDRAVAGVGLLSEIASPVSTKDVESIGNVAKGLKKEFSKIGSTGKIGEKALKKFGGKSQQSFETSLGRRIVDQYVDGIAHESKVGYQSLTKEIRIQIQKDVELMKKGDISDATWHFFESPITGKGGPSKPLMNELKKNGIRIEIHK